MRGYPLIQRDGEEVLTTFERTSRSTALLEWWQGDAPLVDVMLRSKTSMEEMNCGVRRVARCQSTTKLFVAFLQIQRPSNHLY